MSVAPRPAPSLLRGPVPAAVSTARRATPADAPPPAAAGPPVAPRALLVRLVASLALALYGAQAWAAMVQPEAPGRLVGAAFLGAALGLVALLCAPLRRPLRAAVLAAIAAVGALAALLLAGAPARMLDPDLWDNLAAGVGEGIAALPGLSVPYRGVDEWNRLAMLLGGTALAIAGPVLACWPGRTGRPAGPVVAGVMLAVLYAVPAVQLRAEHPLVDGALFALLLAAVLMAERLERRDAPAAVTALVATALVGVALAPRLDANQPWLDYEAIAQSLGERGTVAFSWDHSYAPLDWPRDGREMLRIRAPEASYWKATTLVDFDGVRWREIRPQGIEDDPAAENPGLRWIRRLQVKVRNLRSTQFVTAGTTIEIRRSPRLVAEGAPGSYVTDGRPLRRGHAYRATVYDPRPTRGQLANAGDDFPTSLWPYLSMQLPQEVGGPPPVDPATGAPDPDGPDGFVVFPSWGDERGALGYRGRGYGERVGSTWVERSAYARLYRLAQRLKAASETPWEYIRAVQQHFQEGYAYSETPPARRLPLDAFVFDDRIGYCQQFSGAMALLLRMGGVPARVATGFSPGTLDAARDEYVVRDIDAHSWVEAYFPSYGWMTFDPTPSVAPPRSQSAGIGGDDQDDDGDATASAPRTERGLDPLGIDETAADAGGDGRPVWLLVLAGLVAALLLVSAVAYLVSHRRHARMTVDDRVAELERALRRSGRVPARRMTLAALEHRLRVEPDASAYVRALAAGRYGHGGAQPTRRQRAAVRRALADGLGLGGRLRAMWALPPW
jgi:transglutaminase-like putative cysteine protease